MNTCNFTGRLTKDPELRIKQDGGKYTYFCLAVDAGKNKDGEKQTDFIDFVAYEKRAEFLVNYCIKGSLLEVNSRLHTYTKELNDGSKTKSFILYADNIGILSGGKPKDQAETETAATQEDQGTQQETQADPVVNEAPSLPFEI